MKAYTLLCSILVLGLAACSLSTSAPVAPTSTSTTALSEVSDSTPTTASVPSAPSTIPTPSDSAGVVAGQLMIRSDGETRPVHNVVLALAELVEDSEGNEMAAGFDRVEAPAVETNKQGQFVFSNITPGRYGLILDMTTNSYLLLEPGGEDAIILTVEAGNTVDLGKLEYGELPIPEENIR